MMTEFFKKKQAKLCEDCKKRLKKNPLRILDCKNEKCQNIVAGAPISVDNICEDCKTHFMSVLEYLDEAGVPYNLSPNLVRGLDYYSRTVFEISVEENKRQNSLAAGGRYDYLMEYMGGEPMPGIGFGIGIDRVVDFLQINSAKIPKIKSKCNVFMVQLGDQAKKIAIKKTRELRELGLSTGMAVGKDTIKSQLKAADKVNALFSVIIGQREAITGAALIRDMRDGVQETVELDDLNERLLNMVDERTKEEEEYGKKVKTKMAKSGRE
jgi:histidyl-tRNA synthetase